MQTFSKTGIFDAAAIGCVPLRKSRPWLDNPFTDHETSVDVQKMSNGKSAGYARCPAEYLRRYKKIPRQKSICEKFWTAIGKQADFRYAKFLGDLNQN